MRNSDSPSKRSVETFDVIVCTILAIGYIVRENDHGQITCKFQPCYFYCQIPLLANSTLLRLLSNSITCKFSAPF